MVEYLQWQIFVIKNSINSYDCLFFNMTRQKSENKPSVSFSLISAFVGKEWTKVVAATDNSSSNTKVFIPISISR